MTTVALIQLYHVRTSTQAPFYPRWIPGMLQTKNYLTLLNIITDDGLEGGIYCSWQTRSR